MWIIRVHNWCTSFFNMFLIFRNLVDGFPGLVLHSTSWSCLGWCVLHPRQKPVIWKGTLLPPCQTEQSHQGKLNRASWHIDDVKVDPFPHFPSGLGSRQLYKGILAYFSYQSICMYICELMWPVQFPDAPCGLTSLLNAYNSCNVYQKQVCQNLRVLMWSSFSIFGML